MPIIETTKLFNKNVHAEIDICKSECFISAAI